MKIKCKKVNGLWTVWDKSGFKGFTSAESKYAFDHIRYLLRPRNDAEPRYYLVL